MIALVGIVVVQFVKEKDLTTYLWLLRCTHQNISAYLQLSGVVVNTCPSDKGSTYSPEKVFRAHRKKYSELSQLIPYNCFLQNGDIVH